MQKVQGMGKSTIANILIAKTSGYNATSCGKINFSDGRMAIYIRNREDGFNSLAIDPHVEIEGGIPSSFQNFPAMQRAISCLIVT